MRQSEFSKSKMGDALFLLNNVPALSQDETMGQIVVEILRAGENLNRREILKKLVGRIELAASAEDVKHFEQLILVVLKSEL
ncbi:hypothetical protein [Serratia sp. M24T3]|uniref:hypothetical protein n=1 Tax=Serratia sp. M24T3 TaxID=932213 RepID=UPI00025B90B8|nr:hypothetical protein [Serratia sp. M24T3]EIC84977.1 hypothetical protein SPM24T3_09539 [Serratia sp. M24T3]